MSLFSEIFVWWHGQTMGTRLHTWRKGRLVGSDAQGNRYYQAKDGAAIDGNVRRWVIYNGLAEASRVPPEWHGWLHHTFELPPTEDGYVSREWEKPHVPNLTGTTHAWRPQGSLHKGARRAGTTGDYQAWRPGQTPR